MSKSAQCQVGKTKNIKHPNEYIKSLSKELKDWVLDEEAATQWKGKWRECIFKTSQQSLLHLEIGTGKGKHFSELCAKNSQDYFLGIELKYKPIAQTIESIKNLKCKNGKVIRYNARLLDSIFKTDELNDVYIYFPDPWPKTKSRKHRLLTKDFAKKLYDLQKNKSLLQLRMDSLDYFLNSVEFFKLAGYKILNYSEDLYQAKTPCSDSCLADTLKTQDFNVNHKRFNISRTDLNLSQVKVVKNQDLDLNDKDINLPKKEKIEQELIKQMTQFELIFFQKQIPIKHATFLKTS